MELSGRLSGVVCWLAAATGGDRETVARLVAPCGGVPDVVTRFVMAPGSVLGLITSLAEASDSLPDPITRLVEASDGIPDAVTKLVERFRDLPDPATSLVTGFHRPPSCPGKSVEWVADWAVDPMNPNNVRGIVRGGDARAGSAAGTTSVGVTVDLQGGADDDQLRGFRCVR